MNAPSQLSERFRAPLRRRHLRLRPHERRLPGRSTPESREDDPASRTIHPTILCGYWRASHCQLSATIRPASFNRIDPFLISPNNAKLGAAVQTVMKLRPCCGVVPTAATVGCAVRADSPFGAAASQSSGQITVCMPAPRDAAAALSDDTTAARASTYQMIRTTPAERMSASRVISGSASSCAAAQISASKGSRFTRVSSAANTCSAPRS